MYIVTVFLQAEDGIRDLVRSRGLGDVYKRQIEGMPETLIACGNGCTDMHEAHFHIKYRKGRNVQQAKTG